MEDLGLVSAVSSAVMGYVEEALAETSAEGCRDSSFKEKFNESDSNRLGALGRARPCLVTPAAQ